MIPLFKSHFSMDGRSSLSIEDIFEIGEDLDEIVLVEDTMAGFRKAKQKSLELEKPLRFGLRVESKLCGDSSKLIFFAKNNQGIDTLRRIYTNAFTGEDKVYKIGAVRLDGVQVVVPFYDSFIHRSLHNFGDFSLNLPDDTVFFEESNKHPFDYQISKAIKKWTDKAVPVKSILYKNKEDFSSFQWYKSVCNRRQGKAPEFHNPNLEDFCSDEFCWESYQKQNKIC
tara:strand:+ start:13641 stop:14318 length:678 start_codon:yes stop_codon:yes gene_type:complete